MFRIFPTNLPSDAALDPDYIQPTSPGIAMGGIPYFSGIITAAAPAPTGIWMRYGNLTSESFAISHGCIEFLWDGKYPIFNLRFYPAPSISYDGQSSAADDFDELFSAWTASWVWGTGTGGINKYPSACQIFEEVGEWDEETQAYVPNCWEDGEEVVKVGCVPCPTEDGGDAEFLEEPSTEGWLSLKTCNNDGISDYPDEGDSTLGGLFVSTSWTEPALVGDWELMTKAGVWVKKEAFQTPPGEDGVAMPGIRGRIWLAMYIPYSAKRGGIKCFDLVPDYMKIIPRSQRR